LDKFLRPAELSSVMSSVSDRGDWFDKGVDFLSRIVEKYKLIERYSADKEELEKRAGPAIHGYELQLHALATIAYLVLDPTINLDPKDSRPIFVLLFGYPGTGKTPLAIRLILKLIDEYKMFKPGKPVVELVKINCQRLVSLLEPEKVKETLRRVEQLIDQRGDHIILFLDEADGIAFERGTEKTSSRRELTFWVLSLWDKKRRLLVILTTNYPDLVDDAIRSRVDFVVYFPPILGRDAVRNNIIEFMKYFLVNELTLVCASREKDRERLRVSIKDKIENVLKDSNFYNEIYNSVDKIAMRLSTQAYISCSVRSLYEGIKYATKLFMATKSLDEIDLNNDDFIKGIMREFVKKLESYLKVFGGIFPLQKDITDYEDAYYDLINASHILMDGLKEIMSDINKIQDTEEKII